ncbi:MAG: hypothetical protein AAF653_10560, partial [Chloroflexota bacterium]
QFFHAGGTRRRSPDVCACALFFFYSDADIVLYDPNQTTTIHEDMLFSQAKACDKLYEGMTFQGKVVRTLVNGTTVFVDGEVIGERGGGKFVRPIAERVQEPV